jgi:hypothetical protein
MAAFRPALQRAQLAWRCAAAIHADPLCSYEAALPLVGPLPDAKSKLEFMPALMPHFQILPNVRSRGPSLLTRQC